MEWYWIALLAVSLIMNIVSFALMAADKRRAAKGEWRVRERTLFLVTALMGGIGGTLAMLKLRHKTKHWYFRIFFPVLAVLQVAGVVTLWVLTHR